MARATFVDDQARSTTVDISNGETLMSAAVRDAIEGIVAECGGSAICGTCHVYVDERFVERLRPASDVESGMLECVAAERKPTSRLSCQLVMTPELDGIIVYLPETQR